MKDEDILSGLRRLRPSEGQCAGCGYEHNCGGGCRIGREAAELVKEQRRKIDAAMAQLRDAEDACQTCAHGKSHLPCTGDNDAVGLCGTCERECHCKDCEDHNKWEWDGGGME